MCARRTHVLSDNMKKIYRGLLEAVPQVELLPQQQQSYESLRELFLAEYRGLSEPQVRLSRQQQQNYESLRKLVLAEEDLNPYLNANIDATTIEDAIRKATGAYIGLAKDLTENPVRNNEDLEKMKGYQHGVIARNLLIVEEKIDSYREGK